MKYFLQGSGSAVAMGALPWALVGSWGLLIEDWEGRLRDLTATSWEATIHYYATHGYDTEDLVFTGAQAQGWQQAPLPSAPGSVQYLVHWCSGWTDVV